MTLIVAITGQMLTAAVLFTAMANNIDHAIIYTGLVIISGLAGFEVTKLRRKK